MHDNDATVPQHPLSHGYLSELPPDITEHLSVGCQLIGFDWKYKYLNNAAASHGRKHRSKLLGMTLLEAYPGIEETPLFTVLRRCMSNREPEKFENKFTYSDGSFRWFELYMNPVPEGLFIISADISERKVAEFENTVTIRLQELINSSPDHQTLLSSLLNYLKQWSDCEAVGIRLKEGNDYPYYTTEGFPETFVRMENNICSYDPDGNVMTDKEGNPILECICGSIISGRFNPEKPHFTKDGDFWTNCTTDLMAAISESERPTRARNRCKVMGYESVALIPLRTGSDTFGLLQFNDTRKNRFSPEKISLFRWVADNIANFIARKQSEVELTESRERFRDLIENIDEIVFSLDPEGHFQYISPTVRKLGYDPADLTGKHFNELALKIEGAPDKDNPFEALKLANAPLELAIQDKTDTTRHIKVSMRAVISNGKPQTYQGEIADQTEKKNTEDQLRTAQKMESIGHLAGGVAHDFNNYLSVILGNAEIGLEDLDEKDPMWDTLMEIYKAGERASTLTRQLLAFSRRQILKPRVINLNTLISDLEKMLRRLIEENIRFRLSLSRDLWNTHADPGQIEQVIMNLVVNARDAMPNGGSIVIETTNVSLHETHKGESKNLQPGDYVRLSVSDTGLGMDSSVLERIFEPFYTTKQNGKGTGLGLSTVYGIVKQSGSHIEVSSRPGKGTVFTVYFPRTTVQAAKTVKQVKPVGAKGQENILVVEDEPSLRRLTEKILRSAGYTVITAANGGEALFLFERKRLNFDLLLSDVVMPHLGGPDLYKKLNTLQPELKVLFMSGYARTSEGFDASLPSRFPFIEKPFTTQTLTSKIRDVLDG